MVKEIAGLGVPQPAGAKGPAQAKAEKGFGEFLTESLQKVDALQKEADEAVTRAAQGEGDVQEAMVAVEKADVAFKLMMEVRQKILDAYQEIMRMQV
ncbi:MAG: flagellar hook-basal body complex protein FliE [Candidatus Dadabacteria bacterium]|nr:MAG: flagellar hook-basal body complex protein FliE [Candidatus Dadabacteria bacterium]